MKRTTTPALWTALIATFLIAFATPADAQFSFFDRRKPDEAARVAKSNQVGIFYLLLKDDYGDLPRALYSEEFTKITKTVPIVIEDGRANWITFGGDGEIGKELKRQEQERKAARIELFKRFDMTVQESALIVTDWHGNMLQKTMIGRDFFDEFDPKPFERVAKGAAKFVYKARKSAKKDLKKVKRSIENERWRTARKTIDDILVYKGFDEVAEAEELRKSLVEEGRKQLDAALKIEEADEKKTLLKRIARDFEETEIGKEADEALEKLDD